MTYGADIVPPISRGPNSASTMLQTDHRSSGGMSLIRAECVSISSLLRERWTRVADGGRCATDNPVRHSCAGRIGRGAKPPPQLGQTLWRTSSTQAAQNVHSNVQMRASMADGGRSQSQHSQFGRSSRANCCLQLGFIARSVPGDQFAQNDNDLRFCAIIVFSFAPRNAKPCAWTCCALLREKAIQ